MRHRKTHSTEAAAAKAGFRSRSGCRINRDPTLPSLKKTPRGRGRPDSLARIFDSDAVPLLEADPGIRPVAVFGELMRLHPGLSPSVRRTLERRIRGWRAQHGPDRDVMFRQTHRPGARIGLLPRDSDRLGSEYGDTGEEIQSRVAEKLSVGSRKQPDETSGPTCESAFLRQSRALEPTPNNGPGELALSSGRNAWQAEANGKIRQNPLYRRLSDSASDSILAAI